MRYTAVLIGCLSIFSLSAGKLKKAVGKKNSDPVATMPMASVTCYNNTDKTLYISYVYISTPTVMRRRRAALAKPIYHWREEPDLPDNIAPHTRQASITPHNSYTIASAHDPVTTQENCVYLLLCDIQDEHGYKLQSHPNRVMLKKADIADTRAHGEHYVFFDAHETDADCICVSHHIDTRVHKEH